MSRRELREHIFRLLFRAQFHTAQEMEEQIDFYVEALHEPDQADVDYIRRKTERIMEKLEKLDEGINAVATGWKVDRMGTVDLTIIRLAFFEMAYDEDVPTGVAINEAVELAKRYGSDESPSLSTVCLQSWPENRMGL